MSQIFQYEVWPPLAPDTLYTFEDFINAVSLVFLLLFFFYTKKGKLNANIL